MPRRMREQFGAPRFEGQPTIPLSMRGVTQPWAGLATINSNAATVDIATTLVDSDSMIWAAIYPAATNASSGLGRGVEVRSLNPGVGFTLGSADGQPYRADSVTPVRWIMFRTK